jgi:hypothetical protein
LLALEKEGREWIGDGNDRGIMIGLGTISHVQYKELYCKDVDNECKSVADMS